MRYGELFAGAGGLSLGLDRAGWECAFHCEIEPFPRRVLKARWPDVPLYGDVTTLDGRKLVQECGHIDLLSGGSPCQDLSVAGKRAGMTEGSGTRSSLFYEQVRLYNETNAECLLWENVDGARSSNNGKDFALVLSALVGGAVAVPGNGWRSAGVAVGAAGIAAWRVLDAQFFGVPQRRRRVFVLCSRTGRVDPAEVLLEREGVCRDTQESGETGEAVAPGTGTRIAGADGVGILREAVGDGARVRKGAENLGGTDASHAWLPGPSVALPAVATPPQQPRLAPGAIPLLEVGKRTGASTDDPRAGIGIGGESDPMFTLQRGAQHGVLAFKSGQSEAAGATFVTENYAPTLQGANNGSTAVPAVLAFSSKDSGADATENVSPTLRAGTHRGAHENGGVMPAVLTIDKRTSQPSEGVCATGETTRALTHEGHDASKDGTGRGTPIVAYNFSWPVSWSAEDVAGSLNAHEAKEAHALIAPLMVNISDCQPRLEGVCATLQGRTSSGGIGSGAQMQAVLHGIPRRLLPIECERLMDWPPGWTNIPDENGKPASDSARYRAAGNGVVSAQSEWIGRRLSAAVFRAAVEAW